MTSDTVVNDTNEAQPSDGVQDNNNNLDGTNPPQKEEHDTKQEQQGAHVDKGEQESIKESSAEKTAPIDSNEQDQEDGDYPDEDETANDESTAASRRRRRRSKSRTKTYDDDDTTYFSYSQQSQQTKDQGIVTKTLDRFVDMLNPVEKDDDDEYTAFSADSDRKKQPTLMQQLDKHVLTRFGCSNNPDYIPDDGETAASQSVFSATSYGAKSMQKKGVEDPGDPGVQLKVLDEDNESVATVEQPEGSRGFLWGAYSASKKDDYAKNAKSEIVEEEKKEEVEEQEKEEPVEGADDMKKGIEDTEEKNGIYSPSQLPFDEAEEQEEEEPAQPPKTALESFSENISTGITSIKETVMTKVFLSDVDDAALSAAGDDLNMDLEGDAKAPFEEAEHPSSEANEGEIPAGMAREVANINEADVEVEEKDFIVEQADDEPDIGPSKSEEIPFDEISPVQTESGAEESREPGKPEREGQQDRPNDTTEVGSAPKAQTQATPAPFKKKKKKSFISRILKSKKSKKKPSQKQPVEQLLPNDSLQNDTPNAGLVNSSDEATAAQPEKKAAGGVAIPMDPAQSNKAKREAWRSSKKLSADSEPLVKTDSADFDILLSKNAVDDDWGEATSTTMSTPTKAQPPASSSSPSGVSDFPVEV